MKAKHETLERIEELAQAILEPSSEEFSASGEPWGFRKIIAISDPVVADEQQESSSLFLEGRLGELYLKALDSLETDPALENLARADLENELDDLLRDLVVNREQMKTSPELRKRTTTFLYDIARSPGKYEVAFSVEGINFGSGPLTVGDVVFQQFNAELAQDWNYSAIPDESQGFLDELVNKSVGIVSVNAWSHRKAKERAVAVFDRALNTLRVSIVSSTPFAISDRWLLQGRGEFHAVRQVEPKTSHVEWGAEKGFRPIGLDLTDPWTASTREFIGRLGPLYDGTIHGKLRDALLRSLEWIGTSITRESYDHKIVDLCTALEAVLTTKSDGRKGEAIAFRTMLLSIAIEEPFPYPKDAYRLYDLRSKVVHGGELGACGENDYLLLRLIAQKVVLYAITFIDLQGEINQPSQLIKRLESRERMEKAIAWLEGCQDTTTREVTKYAKDSLNKSPGGDVA